MEKQIIDFGFSCEENEIVIHLEDNERIVVDWDYKLFDILTTYFG